MAKKKNTPLSIGAELTEGVIQAALARPKRGARRLASDLKSDGRTVSESIVRTILRQNGLHRSELRLKVLEERFLAGALDPTDEQLDALISFNPCLRERNLDCWEPGLLVQDILKLGKHGGSAEVVLHVAVDPCCGLTFAALSTSCDLSGAASVLESQVMPFYQQHGIAVRAVLAGHGLNSGDEGSAEFQTVLQRRSIPLTLPAPDRAENGFVTRFARAVRTDFLKASSDALNFDALQTEFAQWCRRFNETPWSGYPALGRTPHDAFREALRSIQARGPAEGHPSEPAPVEPPGFPRHPRPPLPHPCIAGSM